MLPRDAIDDTLRRRRFYDIADAAAMLDATPPALMLLLPSIGLFIDSHATRHAFTPRLITR